MTEALFDARIVRTDRGSLQMEIVLRKIADEIQDFSKWSAGVARAFWEVEAEVFASQGASIGAPWTKAPRDTPYQRWKARNFPGRQTLVLTGRMRKSLTLPPRAVAKMRGVSRDSVWEHQGKNRMFVGTRIDYVEKHHRGSGRPSVVLDPRTGDFVARITMTPKRRLIASPSRYVQLAGKYGAQTVQEVLDKLARE